MMKPFAFWDGFVDYGIGIWSAWEIKASLGTAFAAICSFFDIDEKMLLFLCIAITADFILGVADAIKRSHFRCRAVEYGGLKFVYYALYLGTVGLVNSSLSHSMGMHFPLLDLFISYLVATDCISITRHLRNMGVPVPPLMELLLKKAKKKAEKDANYVLKSKEEKHEEED